jgi:membrane-bound lytic murein transglycosylase MltF
MVRPLLFGLLVLLASSNGHAQSVPDRFDDAFRKYSKQFFGPAFDWRIFKAQALAESNLNPDAKSWVGARGLMQLMPATFSEIRSKNSELGEIDDPRWNIAGGIFYDRHLWTLWKDPEHELDRRRFMFGSYNAGRATLIRAQKVASSKALDPRVWPSIQNVAPQVPQWRHGETLGYVDKIERLLLKMDDKGGVVR